MKGGLKGNENKASLSLSIKLNSMNCIPVPCLCPCSVRTIEDLPGSRFASLPPPPSAASVVRSNHPRSFRTFCLP